MLLRDAVQFVQPVLAAKGTAGCLVCAQSAPFAARHGHAASRPLMALGATEAIGVLHPGIGLRQPFTTTLAGRLLDASQPCRITSGLATPDECATRAPAPHQNAVAARLERVAEPATKAVCVAAFAIAGGQAFATRVPGDLPQARELCLGLACGAADQTTEGVVTGAGRFMPMCAAKPIAGVPAVPFVVQKGVAFLRQALAQSG